MKHTPLSVIILFSVCSLSLWAQQTPKQVFLPDSLKCYNLSDDNSPWSWHRSLQTENLVIFWEKGFGYNLSNPPQLDGRQMAVNTQNLYERLEYFYTYFRDSLQFIRPGSKADKYKMMVMLNYSLDGTAYGGTYDDFIGALWVAPNRIQDKKLNCMAHELGHSFQFQIVADGISDAWGGSGFYEMTSQWMLWRVNPDWLKDENYHFEAFRRNAHKAFLDGENIYRSPYVLQYWAQKHGLASIADLYRNGKRGDDPVITYKQLYNVSQQQFCDEMFDCCQHMVNLDLGHAYNETRQYAGTFESVIEPSAKKGWYKPSDKNIPEDYGFNTIALNIEPKVKSVSADINTKTTIRYSFVFINEDGKAIYGKPASKGKISIALPSDHTGGRLFLVVMGAPLEHKILSWHDSSPNRQYPYEVKFKGALPKLGI